MPYLIFQELISNIEAHRADAKWLVKMLDELLPNTPEKEAQKEQKRLDAVLEVNILGLNNIFKDTC